MTVNYISGGPKMTEAQKSLSDRIMKMTLGQIKEAAIEMAKRTDDDATIVLDFLLGRLAQITITSEFVAFCESLPE
jgi:hypothetical protein